MQQAVEWYHTNLEAGLEWQLQLRPLDDNVGEVEQVDLQRVQHALPRHDNLLRLLLNGQRPIKQGGRISTIQKNKVEMSRN